MSKDIKIVEDILDTKTKSDNKVNQAMNDKEKPSESEVFPNFYSKGKGVDEEVFDVDEENNMFDGSIDTQSIIQSVYDAIADPSFINLTSFRKLIKECKVLDTRVVAGDIDVVYSTSLKKKKNETSNSNTPSSDRKYKINNDNKLNIEQFKDALISLATKKYKNDESDLWNEALNESYSQQKKIVYLDRMINACIKPWGVHKGVLSEDPITIPQLNSDVLRSTEVISIFNKERSALQVIFDHYSKRSFNSLNSSHPDAMYLLDFSELMQFAREYNLTPRLCSISRLIELFRIIRKSKCESLPIKMNARRSSSSFSTEANLDLPGGDSSSRSSGSFSITDGTGSTSLRRGSSFSSDGSRRTSVGGASYAKTSDNKGASMLVDNGGAEALTYPQFIELLGNIALECFTDKSHALAEQRVLSLMQWLDTSKG